MRVAVVLVLVASCGGVDRGGSSGRVVVSATHASSSASDRSSSASGAATNGTAVTTAGLDFMSFYDWAPELQHGWSFGLSPSLSDIAAAHRTYAMPSMFGDLVHSCLVSPTPGCNDTAAAHQKVHFSGTINRGNTLDPNWRGNIALLANRLRPWIANGTVLGVFIGDELTCCANNMSFANLSAVIDTLRQELGPGVGLIYSARASTCCVLPALCALLLPTAACCWCIEFALV